MKKFIYICLLLQSYVVSVFASESMIQLDLDSKDAQLVLGCQNKVNQIIFDNKSLADTKLQKKYFLQPLELSSNFLEDIEIPQSPWSLREDDGIYRQRNLYRDEVIARSEIMKAEAQAMYSQFISPAFDQKKYVDDRVLEMSTDQLSSSVTLGQNNQRDVESPTPSCCSEVLEVCDFTKE